MSSFCDKQCRGHAIFVQVARGLRRVPRGGVYHSKRKGACSSGLSIIFVVRVCCGSDAPPHTGSAVEAGLASAVVEVSGFD